MNSEPGNVRPITCSVKDAQAITGLSRGTISKLIRKRKVRSTKVFKRRLLFLDSIFEDVLAKGATLTREG